VFERILIVCMGNVCRSPAAEYLFRARTDSPGVNFTSAGLCAPEGRPMDPTALELLADSGIDGTMHRARQLAPSMLHEADLILGMEKSHVDAMVRLVPETRGKVYLLDKWLDGNDIPDPYRQQRPAFEYVHEMIARDIESWRPYL